MTQIDHDYALDLASDRLDFELTLSEAADLDGHLASCQPCSSIADALAADDAVLESSFKWQDNSPLDGLRQDEFSPVVEDDDEEPDESRGGEPGGDALGTTEGGTARDPGHDAGDDPGDDSGPQSAPERAPRDDRDDADDDESLDDDEDHGSDQARSPGQRDEDDEDDGAAYGRDDEDDLAPSSPPSERGRDRTTSDDDLAPDDASQEASGRGRSDEEPDDAPVGAGGESAPEPVDEVDYGEEAEEFASRLSDEDLGDVDNSPTPEDAYYDACAAEMVEDAARSHGAPVDGDLNRRAERVLRQEEGMVKTDFGRVAVYRSTRGLKGDRWSRYNPEPDVSSAAAGAIRNAILRSRTGRGGVTRHQPRGRLDSKGIHRIAEKDFRLFKRYEEPEPGKYLVWVMVDVSASMAGEPIRDAASVARALADASAGTPTVRIAVWAWSNPFLPEQERGGAVAGVAKVWETGQPTVNVNQLVRMKMGGTPDAAVLDWAYHQIQKETRSDERPVVILASDGWGHYRLKEVIDKAVKHGVAVKNVALGRAMHEQDQIDRFGRGNYVPWMGSIEATARPLATMVARMAAGK